MRWQAKLVKNTAFALLPGNRWLRQLKRYLRPYPDDIDEWTLEQGVRMVEMFRQVGVDVAGRAALELGTGWQPVIPLIFSLAGAKRVILIDSQQLLDASLLKRVVHNFEPYVPQVARRLGLDAEELLTRLRSARQLEGERLLEALRFSYLAPTDARDTGMPEGSVDLVFSRAVLEHVPPVIIEQIFAEFRRVLSRGGAMCHIIDNGDHWAMEDPSISRVNFLKYSDTAWKWLGLNPLDYQNRLRHSDYVALLEKTGFDVHLDLSATDERALAALEGLKLAPRFNDKSQEDLAILVSYLVAMPVRHSVQ